MIKSIEIKGVHGINTKCTFKGNSIIQGQSLLGKTTILDSIMACYSGYYIGYQKTLPEGTINLVNDSGVISMQGKKIIGGLDISDLIRYIVPGNFFRLNGTTVLQREVMTEILGIDGEIIKGYQEELKEAKLGLKIFESNKNQITDDILRLEDIIKDKEDGLTKPKVVDKPKGNEDSINEMYEKLYKEISNKNKGIDESNKKIQDEYDSKITDITVKHNSDLLDVDHNIRRLNGQIGLVEKEGIELRNTGSDFKCKECGTLIKGTNVKDLIEKKRAEYKTLKEELKKYEDNKSSLLSAFIKNSNGVKLGKLEEYDSCDYIYNIKDRAKFIGLEYKEPDCTKYDEYIEELAIYNDIQTEVNIYNKELEVKIKELKDLNSISYDKEIKKAEKSIFDFNTNLDKKVKETGLDIRLFKTLKNGKTRETFEIYDEQGQMYGKTSHGNNIYIEVLIAKLFIKYLKLDFILIDKFESVGINLREKIYKECKGLQIIATEVTKGKTIKVITV